MVFQKTSYSAWKVELLGGMYAIDTRDGWSFMSVSSDWARDNRGTTNTMPTTVATTTTVVMTRLIIFHREPLIRLPQVILAAKHR
jgi:hypothetical protein